LLSRDDIVSRFGDIRCPTLFVHGTGDAGFPLSTAEEMSSLVGNSAGVIAVEGGTHCMALTHTSAMVGAIRDFMESLS
jgi:pimeloyl-ACP methyl ester carboxylesterase